MKEKNFYFSAMRRACINGKVFEEKFETDKEGEVEKNLKKIDEHYKKWITKTISREALPNNPSEALTPDEESVECIPKYILIPWYF